MRNFEEVVCTYCKAVGGDPDEDIRQCCDELMQLFRESITVADDYDKADLFRKGLKKAVSYTGWEG